MNQERIFKVLKAPHISEKATIVSDQDNQFVFKVAKDATKAEIKTAVEKLWDVKVKSVRTLRVKGKNKRFELELPLLKEIDPENSSWHVGSVGPASSAPARAARHGLAPPALRLALAGGLESGLLFLLLLALQRL